MEMLHEMGRDICVVGRPGAASLPLHSYSPAVIEAEPASSWTVTATCLPGTCCCGDPPMPMAIPFGRLPPFESSVGWQTRGAGRSPSPGKRHTRRPALTLCHREIDLADSALSVMIGPVRVQMICAKDTPKLSCFSTCESTHKSKRGTWAAWRLAEFWSDDNVRFCWPLPLAVEYRIDSWRAAEIAKSGSSSTMTCPNG